MQNVIMRWVVFEMQHLTPCLLAQILNLCTVVPLLVALPRADLWGGSHICHGVTRHGTHVDRQQNFSLRTLPK